MRKTLSILAAVAVSLLPVVASATCTWSNVAGSDSTATCTTGTESGPSAATDGVLLAFMGQGLAVIVSADSGQTLSGAGTLQAYVYVTLLGRWVRNPDLDLTIATSGRRDLTWPAVWIANRGGRVAYVPNGVTVSAGGVTVLIN